MILNGNVVSLSARKAIVTAMEASLEYEFEQTKPTALVWVGDIDAGLAAGYRLGKMPDLITCEGTTLIVSTLITQ